MSEPPLRRPATGRVDPPNGGSESLMAESTSTRTRAPESPRAAGPVTRGSGPRRRAATRRAGGPGERRGARQDALAVLSADHRRLDGLFDEYSKLGSGAHTRRHALAERISGELVEHAAIEESVFYPTLRKAHPEADGTVLESLEEHHIVKSVLAELERTDVRDERFDAKMRVLIENVRHHAREEEEELFPQARRAMSLPQLEEMGDALEAARRLAPRRPHPHVPDEPPGNIVATVVTLPIDIVGRAVRRLVDGRALKRVLRRR